MSHVLKETPHLTETQVEGTRVFHGKLLDVRCDRVALPDGKESTREYIVHQGAAVVIPVLDNGDLLFERQFRYPLRRAFLPPGRWRRSRTRRGASQRVSKKPRHTHSSPGSSPRTMTNSKVLATSR